MVHECSNQSDETSHHNIGTIQLQQVMQHQTDIAEMLVKSQCQLSLPQRVIPHA